ncbi:MAG: RnfABCDGE type electron transport complex subunit B, partial [Oscillospiraceae bacterium]
MNGIVMAVISVSVIGILCAVMLTVAAKVMAVKVDDRFPKVRNELPGANCGACGFAGCDAYAQALVDNPDLKANLCVPGGTETAKKLASALGKEFEAVEEKVAVVKCSGTMDKTSDKVEYQGEQTCKAAKLFYGGKGLCTYGCLGLGDCTRACNYNAIDVVNGKAMVDSSLCIGCGACSSQCPARVIEIIPKKAKVYVGCSS